MRQRQHQFRSRHAVGEIAPGDVGFGEACAIQLGCAEIHPAHIGLSEIGVPQVQTPRLQTAQVKTAEIGTGEIAAFTPGATPVEFGHLTTT